MRCSCGGSLRRKNKLPDSPRQCERCHKIYPAEPETFKDKLKEIERIGSRPVNW